MGEWKQIDRERVGYRDCSVIVVCPCCERMVFLDAQNVPKECVCGRRFQIVSRVEEWIEDTDD